MHEILKQRIGERVSTLRISWRRASLEAGLEAGFIQDIITGHSKEPAQQALVNLALVLQCSTAYLRGESGEVTCETGLNHEASQPILDTAQRPDAVMALRIVDELLAGGHVDAARIAVTRALKEIQAEQSTASARIDNRRSAVA